MNILEARRRTLGGEVYKNAEGNPVSVRSLARMRPGLNVYGKSTQQTTTGAQLIPFELGTEIVSKSGHVRCIPKEDGFYMEVRYNADGIISNDIYFVGKADASHEVGYEEYENLSAGDYRVAINSMDFRFYVVVWRNRSEIIFDSLNQSLNKGFTVQDGDKFRIFIRPSGSPTKSGVVQAIISKQNTELMYEPYTGGQPSPNPDYPQEIENAGDDGNIQVDVLGKNIFDPNYFADHYEVEDVVYYLRYKVPAGSKWTCSTSKPERKDATRNVFFSNRIVFSSALTGVSDQKSRTVVADSGIIYIAIRNGHLTSIVNGNYWVQIEPSESATDYSPFEAQSLTVQTPNGLPGIPVSSGGNYTDENGQQWICDEIDFKRGKYVQRVKERIYGENENVRATGYNAVYTIKQEDADHSTPALSNMFIYIGRVTDGMDFVSLSDYSASIVFGLSWITGEDAEAAKNWFAQKYAEGNPVKVLYVLATPVETDLSHEQLSAYANLHTNRPTTVVSATDGAGLRLTYKTKKSLEVTD